MDDKELHGVDQGAGMRRPLRYLTALSACALILTSFGGSVLAAAATTALPVTRLVFDSDRTGNFEIYAMGVDGSSPVELTRDATYDSFWPKISPDRTQILFYRSPKGV